MVNKSAIAMMCLSRGAIKNNFLNVNSGTNIDFSFSDDKMLCD